MSGFREHADKREQLLAIDRVNLLAEEVHAINFLDDIFEDDTFGVFDDDSGLFDFNVVQRPDERACLEIEVYNHKGFRHAPREWFTVTLSEIEEFVEKIL